MTQSTLRKIPSAEAGAVVISAGSCTELLAGWAVGDAGGEQVGREAIGSGNAAIAGASTPEDVWPAGSAGSFSTARETVEPAAEGFILGGSAPWGPAAATGGAECRNDAGRTDEPSNLADCTF
jgi:hypothetical protein